MIGTNAILLSAAASQDKSGIVAFVGIFTLIFCGITVLFLRFYTKK